MGVGRPSLASRSLHDPACVVEDELSVEVNAPWFGVRASLTFKKRRELDVVSALPQMQQACDSFDCARSMILDTQGNSKR